MAAKECRAARAFKAERHRDENKGDDSRRLCPSRSSSLPCPSWMGMGTMCGVRRYVESLRVQGLGSPWLGSNPRCRGGGGGGSAGRRESVLKRSISSAHERDEMLPPPRPATTTFPSDDGGIASTGPKATVSREFVRFADGVDAKPASKTAELVEQNLYRPIHL
jgi:hypothetical protein